MAFPVLKTAQAGPNKKNYIINGGMMVSQENGSAALTSSATYGADQWLINFSNDGAVTHGQVASRTPGGSPNRYRVTVTTADTAIAAGQYAIFQHKIEGLRVADLKFGTSNAKTITIQFGCKGPAGTYSICLRNGANNRGYTAEFVIAAGEANTDVVKSVTIPGDQTGTWPIDNTSSFDITWVLALGSTYQQAPGAWAAGPFIGSPNNSNFMGTNGNVFELFDVGLYEGTVAPAFQVPDFPSELALCQRYFEKSYAYGTAIGTGGIIGCEIILGAAAITAQTGKNTRFAVRKRATPTVVVYSGNTGAAGKLYDAVASSDTTAAVDSISDLQARTYAPTLSASGGIVALYWHWKADARM